MANLTITVDDDTLKRARIRAIERGESVNQYLAQRLAEYADAEAAQSRQRRAAAEFVDITREFGGSTGGTGWTREDLYDDPTAPDR